MRKFFKSIFPFFFILLVAPAAKAQIIEFTVASPQPDLIEIYSGSSDSGDIDNDGDNDLVMTGIDPGRITALYINDGAGNFTEVQDALLPDASEGLTIFEDLDGDGDLDLFFSGNGFGIGVFTHTYINDGLGVFTLLANDELPSQADTGIAIEDLNGDGVSDIVFAVRNGSGEYVADIFLNDGNGIFNPSGSTAFTSVEFASVECLDMDNDGDMDIIISGEEENESSSVRLYLNDGEGNFTEDGSTVFIAMKADDIDAFDSDGDGDMDILMSGISEDFGVQTLLYENNGEGEFSQIENTGLQHTFAGVNTVADMDLDGSDDLLIIGSQSGGLPNIYNIVYQNQGNNFYVPIDTVGGEYIASCTVNDFNGDQLPDLVIQGFVDRTNLYWNTTSPASVSDRQKEFLAVYPNPSDHSVFFDLSALKNMNALIQVFDELGREVFRKNGVRESVSSLSKETIGSGLFIVCVSDAGSGEMLKRGKFVIQ